MCRSPFDIRSSEVQVLSSYLIVASSPIVEAPLLAPMVDVEVSEQQPLFGPSVPLIP